MYFYHNMFHNSAETSVCGESAKILSFASNSTMKNGSLEAEQARATCLIMVCFCLIIFFLGGVGVGDGVGLTIWYIAVQPS